MKDKEKQIKIKRGELVDLLNQEQEELQKARSIEEMAKDYYGYSIDLEEDCKFVAEEMYDKGHRKIDKYSVVLTKSELEQVKEQAVKEFAEKLRENLDNFKSDIIIYDSELSNLAKEIYIKQLDFIKERIIDKTLKEVIREKEWWIKK